MKRLMKQIQEYSAKRGFDLGLTLVLETDGSGMLVDTVYLKKSVDKPVFKFDNLDELKKELRK